MKRSISARRLLRYLLVYESLGNHEKAGSAYRALFELFPDSADYGLGLAAVQAAAVHGSQVLETGAQLRRLPPPASTEAISRSSVRIRIRDSSRDSAP